MGYRRLIVTVVLTAVLAALAQPLYSVGGIWTGIINSRNNKTVRLDLLKTGGKDNRLTFSKMSMLRFSSDRCPAGTEKSGCYAIFGGNGGFNLQSVYLFPFLAFVLKNEAPFANGASKHFALNAGGWRQVVFLTVFNTSPKSTCRQSEIINNVRRVGLFSKRSIKAIEVLLNPHSLASLYWLIPR